ncbi:MAG: serine/threonine protein kinase [Deltaproteobacteria bacterium]|nr:serine/threonine protein kinase [Deltaproteobacteria bacterium]
MRHFFTLTPDHVLDAIEESGQRCTGLCYALNSLENRVYEVELDDGRRVVGKFYRPGRWSAATILDEHRLLAALAEAEVPVCAPLTFPDGSTLRATADEILFAVFPRTGGRSPDELNLEDLTQLGRLIARIHNVAAAMKLGHRPELSPDTYGRDCLATVLDKGNLGPGMRERYTDAAQRLIDAARRRWQAGAFVTHADCHRGNLLRGSAGWFFLDFDDAAVAPPVQDLWLLLPGRPAQCPDELEALVRGYEQFRDFDRSTLGLIEALRGLRYLRYAAWVASRWEDPSFPRAFPTFGSEHYWQEQCADLYEQVALLEGDT